MHDAMRDAMCTMHDSPKEDLNEKPDWDLDQKRLRYRPDTDPIPIPIEKVGSVRSTYHRTGQTAEEKKNLTDIRSDHRSTVAAAAYDGMHEDTN